MNRQRPAGRCPEAIQEMKRKSFAEGRRGGRRRACPSPHRYQMSKASL